MIIINTCARVSLLKRDSVAGVFLWILRKEHLFFLRATASDLVKPCLNSDLFFISKTPGTALLLKAIVSYKPLPSLSQEKDTVKTNIHNADIWI